MWVLVVHIDINSPWTFYCLLYIKKESLTSLSEQLMSKLIVFCLFYFPSSFCFFHVWLSLPVPNLSLKTCYATSGYMTLVFGVSNIHLVKFCGFLCMLQFKMFMGIKRHQCIVLIFSPWRDHTLNVDTVHEYCLYWNMLFEMLYCTISMVMSLLCDFIIFYINILWKLTPFFCRLSLNDYLLPGCNMRLILLYNVIVLLIQHFSLLLFIALF